MQIDLTKKDVYRVSKTDTDIEKTDTDTIFPNYPGYTDNGYTDIY